MYKEIIMTNESTAVDIAIAELQIFAKAEVTDAVFQSAIENAAEEILRHENLLTHAEITEIKQLATRAGDTVPQKSIGSNPKYPTVHV
jgi:tRNA(Arg) A34 adenosine deaminase TadA